jgi:hypothetical protein
MDVWDLTLVAHVLKQTFPDIVAITMFTSTCRRYRQLPTTPNVRGLFYRATRLMETTRFMCATVRKNDSFAPPSNWYTFTRIMKDASEFNKLDILRFWFQKVGIAFTDLKHNGIGLVNVASIKGRLNILQYLITDLGFRGIKTKSNDAMVQAYHQHHEEVIDFLLGHPEYRHTRPYDFEWHEVLRTFGKIDFVARIRPDMVFETPESKRLFIDRAQGYGLIANYSTSLSYDHIIGNVMSMLIRLGVESRRDIQFVQNRIRKRLATSSCTPKDLINWKDLITYSLNFQDVDTLRCILEFLRGTPKRFFGLTHNIVAMLIDFRKAQTTRADQRALFQDAIDELLSPRVRQATGQSGKRQKIQ